MPIPSITKADPNSQSPADDPAVKGKSSGARPSTFSRRSDPKNEAEKAQETVDELQIQLEDAEKIAAEREVTQTDVEAQLEAAISDYMRDPAALNRDELKAIKDHCLIAVDEARAETATAKAQAYDLSKALDSARDELTRIQNTAP